MWITRQYSTTSLLESFLQKFLKSCFPSSFRAASFISYTFNPSPEKKYLYYRAEQVNRALKDQGTIAPPIIIISLGSKLLSILQYSCTVSFSSSSLGLYSVIFSYSILSYSGVQPFITIFLNLFYLDLIFSANTLPSAETPLSVLPALEKSHSFESVTKLAVFKALNSLASTVQSIFFQSATPYSFIASYMIIPTKVAKLECHLEREVSIIIKCFMLLSILKGHFLPFRHNILNEFLLIPALQHRSVEQQSFFLFFFYHLELNISGY